MTLWGYLIFVIWAVPGAWGDGIMHWENVNTLTAACLGEEGCARRLSQALSGANSAGNSTVGNSTGNATGYKNEIHLVVSSHVPKQQLMQAMADNLHIDLMYIRDNTAAARRLDLTDPKKYWFIIEVPPSRNLATIVEIIRGLPPSMFTVDSLNVVATPVEVAAAPETTTSATSTPLFDLKKRTTRVHELTRPGAKVPITGDMIIASAVGVRGIDGVDPAVALRPFKAWSVPYIMKATVLAWDNGLIFDRPAIEPNFTFQVVWVDQCGDDLVKGNRDFCKIPYSMELLQDLYFGNAQSGLPRSKVVLGTDLFTEQLAHLSSMQKTPMVGFRSGDPQLSAKDKYPNFMRVNTADILVYRISALIFNHFDLYTFDMFFCDDGSAEALIQMTTEEFTADGYRTNAYMFRQFRYSGAPPGTSADLAVLIISILDPNITVVNQSAWAEHLAKKENFDAVFNRAVEFNAHAHMMALKGTCNVLDILSYAQMKGLMGSGHLWSGMNFVTQAYTGSYLLSVITFMPIVTNVSKVWAAGLRMGGFNSEFRFCKPFDGGVWVDGTETLATRPKYQAFAELMRFLGANQAEYFEDYMVGQYPDAAFKNLGSGLWRSDQNAALVDATLLALYGISAAVAKYGMEFTPSQLQNEMLKLDFEGVSRRIRLDANGDVISAFVINNYVYQPNFTEHLARAMGTVVKVGTYDTKLNWIKAPVFFDGRTDPPPDKDKSCSAGMRYDRRTGDCLICPVGRFASRVGMAECELCLPGTFSNTEGASVCKPCGVGSFQQQPGSKVCEICSAGMYNDGVQQSQCKECLAGSYSDAGAVLCNLCERGTYANTSGRWQCTPCKGGKTTVDVASTSASACGCQEGTWLYAASPSAMEHCVSFHCADALECPGGNAAPKQAPGFHAGRPSYENGLPSFLVLCASRVNCPRGRALGVCPAHREDMACDNCEVGFAEDGEGVCTPCAEEGALPLALATTVAVIAVPVHSFFHLRPTSVFSMSSSTLALTVSLGVNALQVTSSISRVEITWIEPMASLREGLKWLTFDVKVLKLQCMSTTNSPAIMYLLGLLAFPIFAVYEWLLLLVAQKWCRMAVTFNQRVNAIGTVLFTLNTGLCLQVARAWQCKANPDGTTSAASAQSLLCYTSDGHRTMLGISAAGTLAYLVAPLALTLWVVLSFPFQIVKTNGLDFFQRYRFLIGRFRPERYWYCTVYMCKGILCALLPALLVNDPPLVLMLFTLLIAGTSLMQYHLCPWRTAVANHLDAGISVGLLWFINAGSTLLPTPGKQGQEMLQRCMMSVCIVFLVAMGSIIILKFYKRLFPKKVYGVFLSHHKGAAAILSRWCKLMFQASTNVTIFLDSDELDDLSLLFNVVAWETANFVLLWTSQTLLRPWCAGEIVSAIEGKVNTVVVLCEEVPRFTDEFIEQVGSSWAAPELKCLMDLGITIEKIRKSYTALRSLPSMKFDRTQGEAAQEATLFLIFRSCVGLASAGNMLHRLGSLTIGSHAARSMRSMHTQPVRILSDQTDGGAGRIAIVADMRAVENRTLSYILRIMLQKKMQVVINVVGETAQQTDQVLSVAKHLLVVLTNGCLKAPSIAHCLVKSLTYSQLTTVPVNADKTFVFPDEDFWAVVKNRVGEFGSDDFLGIDSHILLAAYKSMLKMLALIMSPHASQLILDAEISQMMNRLTANKKVGAAKSPVTTPRAADPDQAAPPATDSAPVMQIPQPVDDDAVDEDTSDASVSSV